GDVEGGRIADVVAVRLEREAEDRDALAIRLAPERVDGESDDPVSAAQIDRIHLFEECDRVAAAQLLGSSRERPDVFGEAPAPEAHSRPEKAPPDAVVVAESVGELGDVGTHRLRDF